MSDNAPPQWHKITSRSLRLGNLKVPRNYTARNHEKRDSSRDSSDVSFPFPETILIAFFTALLYMMTASFEFGYRDAFNVDYNPSIGVAEITDSLYIFLLPLALSLAVSLLIAFIPSFSRRGSLTEFLFLLFPIVFLSICSLISTSVLKPFYGSTLILVPIMFSYYAIDERVVNFLRKLLHLDRASPHRIRINRIPQLLLGGVALSIFAYETGGREANYFEDDEVTICAEDVAHKHDRILVLKSSELFICASANWQKGIVFADFEYFKLPDSGDPKYFRIAKFCPQCIGVEPLDEKWQPAVSCPPPVDPLNNAWDRLLSRLHLRSAVLFGCKLGGPLGPCRSRAERDPAAAQPRDPHIP
jgi:hypothetical protein